MSLTPEQKTTYGAIIDSILANSDLERVSARTIRNDLSDRLGKDVSEYKSAINALIGERFDHASHQAKGGAAHEPNSTTNGIVKSIEKPVTPVSDEARSSFSPAVKRSASESELSEPIDVPKPKKKRVKVQSAEDDDAAFAARLQAEENSRARPTRGGGPKKRSSVKKDKSVKKRKSAAKVKAEDDSEVDSSGETVVKEKKGGFHKLMVLSEPLSSLLGETVLSRPQTVKKIWEYVKERDLQDPDDRRQIRCDDAMRQVFRSDKVHMFTMNKILGQNLYAQDE